MPTLRECAVDAIHCLLWPDDRRYSKLTDKQFNVLQRRSRWYAFKLNEVLRSRDYSALNVEAPAWPGEEVA